MSLSLLTFPTEQLADPATYRLLIFWYSPSLIVTELNLLVLIPYLLLKARLLLYAVSLLLTIFIGAVASTLAFPEFSSGFSVDGFFLLASGFIMLLVGTSGLKFFKLYLIQIRQRRQNEVRAVQSEINLVKASFDTHLAINALNAAYTLNGAGKPDADQVILDLADVIRHQLYGTRVEFVNVESELSCAEKYLSLLQLRCPGAKIYGAFEPISEMLTIQAFLFVYVLDRFASHFNKLNPDSFFRCYVGFNAGVMISYLECSLAPSTGLGSVKLADVEAFLNKAYPSRHNMVLTNDENTIHLNLSIDLSHPNLPVNP